MLKKMDHILNTAIGTCAGVFIGYGIYEVYNYKKHPDLYAMRSAPWYVGIFMHCAVTLIFLAAAVIIKLIIRKMIKTREI